MLVRSRCTHVVCVLLIPPLVLDPSLAGTARIYNAHVLHLLNVWERHCPL